jgi:NADH:ubiquinone oxidoreductase subunit H
MFSQVSLKDKNIVCSTVRHNIGSYYDALLQIYFFSAVSLSLLFLGIQSGIAVVLFQWQISSDDAGALASIFFLSALISLFVWWRWILPRIQKYFQKNRNL